MTLLLLLSAASATPPTAYAWSPDAFPLPLVWLDAPASLTDEEAQAAVTAAATEWNDAAGCTPVAIVPTRVETLDPEERHITVLFDDPGDDLGAGVLGATVRHTSGRTTPSGAEELTSVELIYAAEFPWTTAARTAAGECDQQTDLSAILTHDVGHALGLPHSCENGEACSGDERDATMYWSIETCDDSRATLAAWDRAALQAAYGQVIHPTCIADGPPLTATCALAADDEPSWTTIAWTFGDGGGSSDAAPTYTWRDAGTWPVEACVTYPWCDTPTCAETTVWFAPEGDTGDTSGGPADDAPGAGCGCGGGGASSALLLGLTAVGALRRGQRRAGRRGSHPPPA